MAEPPVATPPRSSPSPAPAPRPVEAEPTAHRKPLAIRLRRDRLLLLMVPGVVYFLVFHYGALFGNLIAFKDYVPFYGVWVSEWVGFQKFGELMASAEFWQATWNTVSIAFLQLLFYFPAPLALVLLHSLTRDGIRRFVQSVVYLPHFISWVIVIALFQQVLGDVGVLNGVLADGG